MSRRAILSVLVENEVGVLSRVVGLFSQRGYNIESLTVAPTDDVTLSRLTVISEGDDATIEQIIKQLYKIVEVVKVQDLSEIDSIERGIMLIKVRAATNDLRSEIKRTVDIFRAQIVDVTPETYTVQVVGPEDKLSAFIQAMGDAKVLEVARSGVTGIARGTRVLSV